MQSARLNAEATPCARLPRLPSLPKVAQRGAIFGGYHSSLTVSESELSYNTTNYSGGAISSSGLYQRVFTLLSLELWMRDHALTW